MKSKLLAVLITGAFIFLTPSLASAWSGDTALSGVSNCDSNVTWTVTLSSAGANPATPPVVVDSNRAVVAVGATLTQNEKFTDHVTSFPVTLSIHVNYPAKGGDLTHYPASATVQGATNCVTTTTTTRRVTTTTTSQPTTTSTTIRSSTTSTTKPTTTSTERVSTTTTRLVTTTLLVTTTSSTVTSTTVAKTTTTIHIDSSTIPKSSSTVNTVSSSTLPRETLAKTGTSTAIPLAYAGLALLMFGAFLLYLRYRF